MNTFVHYFSALRFAKQQRIFTGFPLFIIPNEVICTEFVKNCHKLNIQKYDRHNRMFHVVKYGPLAGNLFELLINT
jgi:hypothetical protein